MIPLGNYSFGETEEEIKAKAAGAFRPIARSIKEDPQKAKEIIAPTIQDPEQRAKFEAQLEPLIQEQKKEARKFSIPLIVLGGITVLSLTTLLLLRRRRKQNPRLEGEETLCGWCRTPIASPSGFCSLECEKLYGYCPSCGSPSRGNRLCWECKELGLKNNPFKRKKTSYVHPTFEEKFHGPVQWQVEFETTTGSHGTKTYMYHSQAQRAMQELDNRDDIKWSTLRRIPSS